MSSLYPAGPATVPAGLSAPTASYRRHAWLAMAGLLVFMLLYVGLLSWFGWTAYRLIKGLGAGTGGSPLFSLLVAACAGFLAFFMAKALIFRRRAESAPVELELNAREQPELFAFLHQLADEAGAPRPYRVFLSPRVNASVSYDLSLLNLLIPSRKNLEIGMGLANVLNLGELKAVLAHEFGHFAQRSMAVGRWVYVAQQIAAHIVAKRDALDTLLTTISRLDVRIAWIGWTLSLIIWSIRSLVEIVFRWVVIAQRALSREMEFQADLVAASLTGSDALVHALHRLGAADEAWDRAVQFAVREAGQGRAVRDIFALQTRVIERLRQVLDTPDYGQAPSPSQQGDAAGHRVFKAELAPPPQMWSTHPSNDAREHNVKRVYVACAIDERPALALLRDAQALKEQLSGRLLREPPETFADAQTSLANLDREYEATAMARRYRGAYLGRSCVRNLERVQQLYEPVPAGTDLAAAIAALYSAEDGQAMEQLRELEEQHSLLLAIRDRRMQTEGDVINWRGERVSRKQLPRILAALEAELTPLRERVLAHDRRCRSLHLAAAEQLGGNWAAALRGQLAVLHYAEHARADLADANALLINTYHVVTADRRVSADELRRLVASCNQVQSAIATVYARAPQLVLDDGMAAILEVADWQSMLEQPLGLVRASEENINGWMKHVVGWVQVTQSALSALRHAALESLLKTEDHVAQALGAPDSVAAPSTPAVAPREYPLAMPGKERKQQARLGWWDRFQTASGFVPATARLAVAGGIIGSVFFIGDSVGHASLTVLNGLARDVTVTIGEASVQVPALGHVEMTLPDQLRHSVETRTSDSGELIERFDESGDVGGSQLVYNVASAAPLVEWTASYGNAGEVAPQPLGAPRWISTSVDHLFSDPPESIQSRTGNGHRTVLSAVLDASPDGLPRVLGSHGQEAKRVIDAHARWDRAFSTSTRAWLAAAAEQGNGEQIVQERLRGQPEDVSLLRLEQDLSEGEAHARVCERHRGLAAQASGSPALQYVAARCIDSAQARNDAFLSGRGRWPADPWFALAAGYVHSDRQQWQAARESWQQARKQPELIDFIAADVARMERVDAGNTGVDLSAWAGNSEHLRMLLAIEGNGEIDPLAQPYRMLRHGQLGQAVSALQDPQMDADTRARILRLAAASEGAPQDIIVQATQLDAKRGVDGYTVWSAWALALREHAEADALQAAALTFDPQDAPAMSRFVTAVARGAGQGEAERELGDVGLRARGLAYSAAVVLRGDSTPQAWRDQAKLLLFAPERPYFN